MSECYENRIGKLLCTYLTQASVYELVARPGQYPQALKLESLVEKLEAWHQLGKIETRVLAAARTVSEKCIQQAALNLQVSKQIAHSSTFDELHFQVSVLRFQVQIWIF